jgi:hypothetical protein
MQPRAGPDQHRTVDESRGGKDFIVVEIVDTQHAKLRSRLDEAIVPLALAL